MHPRITKALPVLPDSSVPFSPLGSLLSFLLSSWPLRAMGSLHSFPQPSPDQYCSCVFQPHANFFSNLSWFADPLWMCNLTALNYLPHFSQLASICFLIMQRLPAFPIKLEFFGGGRCSESWVCLLPNTSYSTLVYSNMLHKHELINQTAGWMHRKYTSACVYVVGYCCQFCGNIYDINMLQKHKKSDSSLNPKFTWKVVGNGRVQKGLLWPGGWVGVTAAPAIRCSDLKGKKIFRDLIIL